MSSRLVPATSTVELEGGLSLRPRLKLLLTFFRTDPSVKPIDEWRLKHALLDFLLDSLSLSVPDDDLLLRRRPELHKRKREDPVVSGTLFVREISFLPSSPDAFVHWRDSVLSRIDGIELNTEGVLFRLSAEVPASDDYERLRKSWEEFYARHPPGNRSSRGSFRRPDTIVLKGLPSRWLAETRVSSKPSMLVTHTIFSVLGKIRNLNIAGDTDLNIISGLHCKIWVQFENYSDFCHALSSLCGRSLHKEGSCLKADYEVACDTEGYFRNKIPNSDRALMQQVSQIHVPQQQFKMEISKPRSRTSRFDSDVARPRRFRE